MMNSIKGCCCAVLVTMAMLAQVAVAQSNPLQMWLKSYKEAIRGVPPYLLTGEYDAKSSKLHFVFKNVSNASIELDSWTLPWGNPNGVDYLR